MTGENLTLSDAELARCEPIRGEGGKALRARCPFHGSDHQRSLRVNTETGHFKCHACGAWGYLDTARERRRDNADAFRQSRPGAPRQPPTRGASRAKPSPPPPPRPDLADLMATYRAALPESPGADYLRERRIPLDVAQAAGVGYAAPGTWAHRDPATGRELRGWHHGRLVFPHTDPTGNVVNLYGRAVGDAPKETRHDHLAGVKGYFNAQALREGAGPVTICEGAFDALALMAADAPRVVAIFGVNGWRWDWARTVRELILALDADAAGQTGLHELAPVARLRGKRVAYLEADAYGGEKDAAAAWAAGTLRLGDWPDATAPPPEPTPESASAQGTLDPWDDATGDPGDDWEPLSSEPSPPAESFGTVERLHPSVRLDGFRVVISGLDNRARHAVMGAVAGHCRRDVRLTPTRHDYRGGVLTLTPDGYDLVGMLALLMSRTLKELDAERSPGVSDW